MRIRTKLCLPHACEVSCRARMGVTRPVLSRASPFCSVQASPQGWYLSSRFLGPPLLSLVSLCGADPRFIPETDKIRRISGTRSSLRMTACIESTTSWPECHIMVTIPAQSHHEDRREPCETPGISRKTPDRSGYARRMKRWAASSTGRSSAPSASSLETVTYSPWAESSTAAPGRMPNSLSWESSSTST